MKIVAIVSCCASLMMLGCASKTISSAPTNTFTLPSWGHGAPRLQIEAPTSFTMRRHQGIDFDVFYFTNAATKSSLGLYAGHHPSLRSSEAGAKNVQQQQGNIGDVSVEWLRWSRNHRRYAETLVNGFYRQIASRQTANLVIHIFASASDESEIARLEAAAATLRMEESK